MSFLKRVVSTAINDYTVKTLANSPAFQRFALKTHHHVEDAKNFAATGVDTLLENVPKDAEPAVRLFAEALTTVMKEEIVKDVTDGLVEDVTEGILGDDVTEGILGDDVDKVDRV